MDVQRIGVKLFAENSGAVKVQEFVPIFHSWIQRQCVHGHLLIDVHDYSHIHNGPGILLVAHEGNFSTDLAEGKLGLSYFRKQPVGEGAEVLKAAMKTALQAASLLEEEPALGGRLRFRRDEALITANDRLLAPNDAAGYAALQPAILRSLNPRAVLTHVSTNPKDRLTIRAVFP
jgi:hypothetical protein